MNKVSNGVKKILVTALGLAFLAAGCTKSPIPGPVSTGTVEIAMTENGFNPSIVTVRQGTKVIFKNTDTDAHWPASNSHPTHTDLPGFDALLPIEEDHIYSFTFNMIGTWGFHDHLHPNLHGSVIVIPSTE